MVNGYAQKAFVGKLEGIDTVSSDSAQDVGVDYSILWSATKVARDSEDSGASHGGQGVCGEVDQAGSEIRLWVAAS